MQLLIHLPDELGARFKQSVPARSRSAFVRQLLEEALPAESDPMFLLALQVEADAALVDDVAAWDATVGDGLDPR